MAKVKQGFLTGVVGSVVTYSYYGEQYARSLPRKRSKGSWTEKQKLNRKRFSVLSDFWSRFGTTLIEQIWKVAVEGKRGINLFISTNSPAFGPDGTLVDLKRIHFSTGKLPLPHQLVAKRSTSDPERVEATWEDDSGSVLARSDDELIMMIAYDGKFSARPIATGFKRKAESALISLPSGMGTAKGIYLFFASNERMLYSPDEYFQL
jgi:hypothetical protein